ncbi:hypothetical protein ACFQ1S_12690, partial [Kibdelosporangium lantanae]
CTGEGCIPQPPPSPPPPGPGGGPSGGDDSSCSLWDPSTWLDCIFRGIVIGALNPLLDLVSHTLLTTPAPDKLPRIGELWNGSWQIVLACYGLLVLIAGILIMTYETLQTRHSVKEIAPRLIAGFIVGALSLWVASKAIAIANALAEAVMGGGVDPGAGGAALKTMVLGSLTGGIWILLIGLVLAAMLVVLLVTYVVRVAITIILIVGAPLALMFHALPQSEGIARWWWKAFGGCLAIQVLQSLTLITAIRLLLDPGGVGIFGPTGGGVINLLVVIALIYILFKIPFWVLGSIRGGGGRRSLVGSLVRGFIAYKTFGLMTGRGRQRSSGGAGSGRRSVADPYARTRATGSGQYMLPLAGLRRSRRPRPPVPLLGKVRNGGPRGEQLALPLGDDWPENRPVLGRDGQYRLPMDVERVPSTPPPPAGSAVRTGRSGKQLKLQFDPYDRVRADRAGQYALPLDGVRRTRPPVPPPPVPTSRPRPPRQPELPFDPYKGNRPDRSGQYPLPLDGLRRVPPPAPAPQPRPPRQTRQPQLPFDPYKGIRPSGSGQYALPLQGLRRTKTPKPPPEPPASPSPPAATQLRLPIDMPKPPRKPGGRKP